LIHLLGGDSPDPLGDYEAVNQEMALFNPELLNKPQLVVLNKMDLPEAQAVWPQVEEAMHERGVPVMYISAATQQQVQKMLYEVQLMLDTLPTLATPTPFADELPEITPGEDEKAFQIYQVADDKWLVEGVAIERAVQMTNWDYYEAGMRFQRILKAMGITEALRAAGVQDGHTVRIGDVELEWGYENAFGE
jgi:GTP-binding protein